MEGRGRREGVEGGKRGEEETRKGEMGRSVGEREGRWCRRKKRPMLHKDSRKHDLIGTKAIFHLSSDKAQ